MLAAERRTNPVLGGTVGGFWEWRGLSVSGCEGRGGKDHFHEPDPVPTGRASSQALPDEQAALKVLYLVTTQNRSNRADVVGRINGWKPILNALTIHYGDRVIGTY